MSDDNYALHRRRIYYFGRAAGLLAGRRDAVQIKTPPERGLGACEIADQAERFTA